MKTVHRPVLWIALLGLAVGLAGCSWFHHKEILMPVQQSAAEQFKYATERRSGSSLELVFNKKRLADSRATIRRAFVMVSENFPDDRKFTPLAKLEVLEMDAALDHPRAESSARERREVIKQLDQLAKAYPEYEYLQAKVLYDRGRIYRMLGDFSQAQACFKDVRDTYLKHKDPVITELAKRAAQYYNEVYVHE